MAEADANGKLSDADYLSDINFILFKITFGILESLFRTFRPLHLFP